MNFETDYAATIRSFLRGSEEEVLRYVCQEMRDILGDDMPIEEDIKSYLFSPGEKTSLSAHIQAVVTDKLLEFAEISFRTLCDLIRYGIMRDTGVVKSMDEFLELLHPKKEC